MSRAEHAGKARDSLECGRLRKAVPKWRVCHYPVCDLEGVALLRFAIVIVAIGILSFALPDLRARALPELSQGGTTAETLLHPTAFRCGTFDGKFSCRRDSGVVVPHGGKNAIPGAQRATEPLQEMASEAGGAPLATDGAAPSAVPGGMAGSPPNCRCSKGTEQLGGHCIAYTEATGLSPMRTRKPARARRKSRFAP